MSVEGSDMAPSAGYELTAVREGEFDFGRVEWENTRLIRVPVERVRPDPEQPRKHFDETSLGELGRSLRLVQVQPIVVRRDGAGWVLVDGERRWRAARAEGVQTLDAREMTLTDRRELMTMVIQLAANTHRDQLTLEEQALGVLRLAEGGFPVEAIARVLGYQDEHVVSLLTIARSGEARALISIGRLGSVSAWDEYQRLEPAVRKRVLDSTDAVTVDRCERARREHELAERAKQLRLAMPRSPAPPVAHGEDVQPAAPADIPGDDRDPEVGDDEDFTGAHGEHGSGSEGDADGASEPPAAAEAASVAAPEEKGLRYRTFAKAIDAYHLEAHDERDALIAGLDGVREGLDTLLTSMGGSAEITDPVFDVLRAALAPVQQVLDTALKKIVRPPEFAPCCVLSAAAHSAAHHADRGEREGGRS